MSLLKPSEFLARARPGHCGTTAEIGDCTIGESGSFGEVTARWSTNKLYKDDPTPHMMKQAMRSCLSACNSCTQCNYVSVSWYFKDCSWYTACDTEELRRPPDGNWSHFQSASAFTSLPRTVAVSGLTWQRSASKEKRLALRLPQAESGVLEWVQPHAAMRVALVLYGKVGTWTLPSSGTNLVGVTGGQEGALSLLTQARRTFETRVLRANPRVRFEAYAHSWSPLVGKLLDTAWRPVWSRHEAPRTFASPAQSAACSMSLAIAAKREAEAAANSTYDLVWVMRYDLAFLAPFSLDELPRAQLWLPGQCCEWQPDPFRPVVPPSMRHANRAAEQACLGGQGRVMDLCRTSHFLNTKGVGPAAGKATLVREAERNGFVNDYFFIAPSRTADTWAALYHRYDHYTAALDELGIPLRWQHFMWAAHVHHALRVSAGVHAVLDVGVSVNLVRNVANANGRSCVPGVSTEQHIPALAEPVKPGIARLCPRRGEVRCLIGSKRCLLDGEFPQSMQDSNRTSAPTPELRRPTRLATHARKPRSLRSPRKAKGRERLAKRVGWNPVLG